MSNEITASHVANFFLIKGEHDNIPLKKTKLLKLIYIGYGWVHALTGVPLFEDQIEAWEYGPVVPSIYYEFMWFQDSQINCLATLDIPKEGNVRSWWEPEIPKKEKRILHILNGVWEMYKGYNANTLVKLTHELDTPWAKTYDGEKHRVINPDLIEKHYLGLIDDIKEGMAN